MGKDKDKNKTPPDGTLDDDDLWEAMTEDVQPLPGRTYRPKPSQKALPPKKPDKQLKKNRKTTPPAVQKPPAGRETDARTAQRLRRGQLAIEGRIDLHGLNRDQARQALESFILSAHRAGKRCVLVITGKGKTKAGADSWLTPKPGVLKQNVPAWLNSPPLRDIVLKTAAARPQHGGSGALYVLLRRDRKAGT